MKYLLLVCIILFVSCEKKTEFVNPKGSVTTNTPDQMPIPYPTPNPEQPPTTSIDGNFVATIEYGPKNLQERFNENNSNLIVFFLDYYSFPGEYSHKIFLNLDDNEIEITSICSRDEYQVSQNEWTSDYYCLFNQINGLSSFLNSINTNDIKSASIRTQTLKNDNILAEVNKEQFFHDVNHVGYQFIEDNDSLLKSRLYTVSLGEINGLLTPLYDFFDDFYQPMTYVEGHKDIEIDFTRLFNLSSSSEVDRTSVRLLKINPYDDNGTEDLSDDIFGSTTRFPFDNTFMNSTNEYLVQSRSGNSRQVIRYENPTDINLLTPHKLTLPNPSNGGKGLYILRLDILSYLGYRNGHLTVPFFIGESPEANFDNFKLVQDTVDGQIPMLTDPRNNFEDQLSSFIGGFSTRADLNISDLDINGDDFGDNNIDRDVYIFSNLNALIDSVINGDEPTCTIPLDFINRDNTVNNPVIIRILSDETSNISDWIQNCEVLSVADGDGEDAINFYINDSDQVKNFVLATVDSGGDISYTIKSISLSRSVTTILDESISVDELDIPSNNIILPTPTGLSFVDTTPDSLLPDYDNLNNLLSPYLGSDNLFSGDSEADLINKLANNSYQPMGNNWTVGNIIFANHTPSIEPSHTTGIANREYYYAIVAQYNVGLCDIQGQNASEEISLTNLEQQLNQAGYNISDLNQAMTYQVNQESGLLDDITLDSAALYCDPDILPGFLGSMNNKAALVLRFVPDFNF